MPAKRSVKRSAAKRHPVSVEVEKVLVEKRSALMAKIEGLIDEYNHCHEQVTQLMREMKSINSAIALLRVDMRPLRADASVLAKVIGR